MPRVRRDKGRALWTLGILAACAARTPAPPAGPSGAADEGAAPAVEDSTQGAASDEALSLFPVTLDAHMHLSSTELTCAMGLYAASTGNPGTPNHPPATADVLVKDFMGRSGATRGLVLSSGYIWGSDRMVERLEPCTDLVEEKARVRAENELAASQAALHAGTLVPFCGVHPVKDYALDELEYCAEDLGMKGLKLHFSNSALDLRQPEILVAVTQVVQRAAALDLAVIAHFDDLAVDPKNEDQLPIFLSQVVATSPGLRLSLAHVTGGGEFPASTQATFQQLIDADASGQIRGDVQIWVDIAAVLGVQTDDPSAPTPDELAALGEQLQAWGLDRVLWGSDNSREYPSVTEAGWPLSAEDFAIIAAQDGDALLGLD